MSNQRSLSQTTNVCLPTSTTGCSHIPFSPHTRTDMHHASTACSGQCRQCRHRRSLYPPPSLPTHSPSPGHLRKQVHSPQHNRTHLFSQMRHTHSRPPIIARHMSSVKRSLRATVRLASTFSACLGAARGLNCSRSTRRGIRIQRGDLFSAIGGWQERDDGRCVRGGNRTAL